MKLKKTIPKVILVYYLLNSMMFGIFNDNTSIKYLPIVFSVYILYKTIDIKRFACFLSIWITYVILNLCFAYNQDMFVSRIIFYVIVPICILYSLSQILVNEEIDIYSTMFDWKIWFLLNCFAITNIIIIQLQINGIPLFINYNSNIFSYYDQIDGMFGLNGTPNWSLFFSFLIIYNYTFFIKEKRIFVIILTILEIIPTVLQSLHNDNKGIFTCLSISFFILLYFYVNYYGSVKKKVIRSFVVITVFFIVILLLFNSNGNVSNFIRVNVLGYILMPFGYTGEIDRMHQNERWDTFIYAIQNFNGLSFGMGIGWNARVYNIAHFGISELSNKTGFGGLIYYFLWIFSATFMFMKSNIKKYIIVLIWIILSIYTQVFWGYQLTILSTIYVSSICYLLNMGYNMDNKRILIKDKSVKI